MTIRRSRQLLIGGTVLAAGLLVGPLTPRETHAFIGVCRDDPQLWLSNSHKVQVSFSLPDTTTVINSVQSIHYDIHIPAGASVASWNDPSSPFTGKSTWTVTADMPKSEYKVTGVVWTNAASISTTLTQQVVLETSKGPGSSVTNSSNGLTNSYLTVDQPKAP